MKQIEIAPNYYVTEDGEIYSKTGRKRKLSVNAHGYAVIDLYENNKPTKYAVHRFVAKAFIPNPENKPCVNHIDGNKLNNKISNLEWCTYSENNKYAFAIGLSVGKQGEDVVNSILTNDQVHEICSMMQEGYRNIEIHNKLGIEKYLLKNIRVGNSWLTISSQYKIPNKSLTYSEETLKWICRMLEQGMRNVDIVALCRNNSVTKSMITKIKNRKTYKEISKDYKF